MNFKFDIECTPAEARQFFGLPDVAPMQEALMKELEERLRDNIRTLDPETMVKTWMPVTIQGWQEMQKMFWGQVGGMGMPDFNSAPKSSKKTASSKD